MADDGGGGGGGGGGVGKINRETTARRASAAFVAGVYATAGARGADKMEDRHVVHRCLFGESDTHVVAVFDGHRGCEAAEFCAEHIVPALEARLGRRKKEHEHASGGDEEEIRAALVSVFEALDESFTQKWKARCVVDADDDADADADANANVASHKTCEGNVRFPGCCAVVVLCCGDTLVVANAVRVTW